MTRRVRGMPAHGSLGIPGYERAEEVRRDRLGAVCRAWDAQGGRDVEIRLLRVSALDEPTCDELRNRLSALERLPRHANLAAVLATGITESGRGYVAGVAEPGGTLADRRGALPWQRVARLGAAVASGLEAAHAAGVLHGVIGPRCILLSALDEPRLADLGVAQVVSQIDPREGGGGALSPAADVAALARTLGAAMRERPPDALAEVLEGALTDGTANPAGELARGLRDALAGWPAESVAEEMAPTPGPRRGTKVAVAGGAAVLTLGGMVLAPRFAGDMVHPAAPAPPVDPSLRLVNVDPAHWEAGSRWNVAGPALTADHPAARSGAIPAVSRACGGDVGAFVYTFAAPRVRGSAYVVGAWLSSNVARMTASPDAFSDVALVVNGSRYRARPAGAVSNRGQYFEWTVNAVDVRPSGNNSLEYTVDPGAVHRHGLCVHFGDAGLDSAQQITVRAVG